MLNKIKEVMGGKEKLYKVGHYLQCTQEVMNFVTRYDMQWVLSMADGAYPVRILPWRREDVEGAFVEPVTIEIHRPQEEGSLMGKVYIHNHPPKNSSYYESHKERSMFLCKGLFFESPADLVVFRLDKATISIADDNFYHKDET